VFLTAKDAARHVVKHRGLGSLQSAPAGALLYFAPDATNDQNGHAGIYLGNGEMISARPGGVSIERVDSQYNRQRFVGWGDPPASFSSRPMLVSGQVPAGRLAARPAGVATRGITPSAGAPPGGDSSVPRSATRPGASLTPTLPALAGLSRSPR
jgi:hypothetical protein